MDATPLNVESRNALGKGAARKLRGQGLVPGVVYRAGEEAAHISVSPKEVQDLFRATGNPNTLLAMKVDGKDLTCLLKDYHKHPVSRDVLHCDFYEVKAGEPVTVEVPVRETGKAAGATLGGKIRFLRRTLRVNANPSQIPAEISIDVSPLNIGDFVRAGEVALPEGCKLAIDVRTNILTCHGKKGGGAKKKK